MIKIKFNSVEFFDESNREFRILETKEFRFEHSLKSISTWESKYKKSFLEPTVIKSPDEIIDYFCMMCLDEDFNNGYMNDSNAVESLSNYIKDKQSATVISVDGNKQSHRVLTSEVIYAYMANAQVPFSCDEWNFNRLMTLINVIGSLNDKPKPMNRKKIIEQNISLNEKRKNLLNTKG